MQKPSRMLQSLGYIANFSGLLLQNRTPAKKADPELTPIGGGGGGHAQGP